MTTSLDTLRAQPLSLIGPATQALETGSSIAAWKRAMEQAITRSQTASYLAAIKDRTGIMPKGLSRAERKDLQARINEQLKYLDGFARDLKAGKLTPAQAQARAALYSGATRATYYSARHPGLPFMPGDGGTPCRTNCKCSWEQKGTDYYYTLHPAEHCQGCLDRAAGNPYQAT